MKIASLHIGHVFLASASLLSYEILLTRIFAVSQWNHLVFMVISIALFGLAAGGTLFSICSMRMKHQPVSPNRYYGTFSLCSLQSVAVIGSYAGLNSLPLDYYRLSVEPIQLGYLLVAYLMLASPFLAAGLLISAAYAARPQKAGPIYFATMAGSAAGAAIPLALTRVWGEPVLVVLSALLPLSLLPLYLLQAETFERYRRLALFSIVLGVVVVVMAAYLMSPSGSRYIRIRSSEYKGLNQVLRFPDTRVEESHRRLQGHIDRVRGPYLRYAPGLSLGFLGRLPPQQVVYTDRDIPLTLYSPTPAQMAFARSTLSYAAYVQPPAVNRVMVIPQNGGLSLACALASGAGDVQVTIRHPDLSRIVENHYNLKVNADHPRAFVALSSGSFDIIQIENWGNTIPGADALTQNHSLTIDAFEAYLGLLSPEGALTISRRLMLPPSDSMRLWATAYEALVRSGSPDPRNHIALLRNWDTYTLVVTRRPLNNNSALLEFASRHGFDLVFWSQLPAHTVNHFSVLPQPYYFQSVAQLANAYQHGRSQQFFDDYPLDIEPQTDLRPFPGRLLKWTRIRALYRSIGSRFYSFFLSGEIVVMVVLAEALLVTLLLLVAPLRFMREQPVAGLTRQSLYFFGIGCGFMFLEIYFIHLSNFLLGDPVVAFSVVVTGLLISSGLGGLISQIWTLKAIRIIIPLLAALIAVLPVGWLRHSEWLLELPSAARLAIVFLLLVPVGLLIGMPFPMGIRFMAPTATARAYAWSVNGCASVLSAILAAQMAISFGLVYLVIGAMAAYALSFITGHGYLKSEPTVDNTAIHGNKI